MNYFRWTLKAQLLIKFLTTNSISGYKAAVLLAIVLMNLAPENRLAAN